VVGVGLRVEMDDLILALERRHPVVVSSVGARQKPMLTSQMR
jgi:hypothetical protein